MTTTLQEALLKAGLVKEKSKLPNQKEHKTTLLKSAEPKRNFEEKTQKEFKKPIQNQKPFQTGRTQFKQERQKPGFIEHKHIHHVRTECEACKKNGPDVEYYEHSNKLLNVKWLCVRCADRYNIHDDTRQTMQSSFAMSRMFRREWGPTKVFK